jgi:hypothetical protein
MVDEPTLAGSFFGHVLLKESIVESLALSYHVCTLTSTVFIALKVACFVKTMEGPPYAQCDS